MASRQNQPVHNGEAGESCRKQIDDAFVRAVSEKGFSKAQVSSILNSLGISRNTFYYHYSDKFDLVQMIYLRDLEGRLRDKFNEAELVYFNRESQRGQAEKYPYYARVEVGAHMYDLSGFLQCVIAVLASRPSFYRNLFAPTETQWLRVFGEMYYPEVRTDVVKVLGGRYMDEFMIDYLAQMGVQGILSTINYAIRHPSDAQKLAGKDRYMPFLNFYWESLSEMVKSHPVARSRCGS